MLLLKNLFDVIYKSFALLSFVSYFVIITSFAIESDFDEN